MLPLLLLMMMRKEVTDYSFGFGRVDDEFFYCSLENKMCKKIEGLATASTTTTTTTLLTLG